MGQNEILEYLHKYKGKKFSAGEIANIFKTNTNTTHALLCRAYKKSKMVKFDRIKSKNRMIRLYYV